MKRTQRAGTVAADRRPMHHDGVPSEPLSRSRPAEPSGVSQRTSSEDRAALARKLARRTASLWRTVSRTPGAVAHYSLGSVFVMGQLTKLGLRQHWD